MVKMDLAQSSSRRDQILRTAAEFFGERGYDSATVREIASAVGFTNSGSLYHHFKSKEAILKELLHRFWTIRWTELDVILSKKEPATDALQELVASTLQATIDYPSEILILNNDSDTLALSPEFAFLRENESRSGEVWRGLISEAIEEGTFKTEIDIDLVYRTLMGAILWGGRWFDPSGPLNVTEVAEGICEIVFYGAATSKE